MPRCPQCDSEIGHLKYYEMVQAYSHFMAGAKYVFQTNIDLDDTDDAKLEYECYVCGEVLFTDEESANAFLLGEGEKYDQE